MCKYLKIYIYFTFISHSFLLASTKTSPAVKVFRISVPSSDWHPSVSRSVNCEIYFWFYVTGSINSYLVRT